MKYRTNVLRIFAAAFILFLGAQANAQSNFPTVFPQPILILDQEELFNSSDLGKAILLKQAESRTILLQESRLISEAFEVEEKSLTEIRSEVSPEEFRLLSEDFDARVQVARESQLEKDVAMQQSVDRQRRRFLLIAAPYLSEIMIKYNASAIVDRRSVLLFDRDMDITSEAIELLNRVFEQNPELANEEE